MPFIYYIYLLYYFVSQLLVWLKMDKKEYYIPSHLNITDCVGMVKQHS